MNFKCVFLYQFLFLMEIFVYYSDSKLLVNSKRQVFKLDLPLVKRTFKLEPRPPLGKETLGKEHVAPLGVGDAAGG